MSAISYTDNYNLTQYSEVTEPVFLNDITRDNALIDTAINTVSTEAAAAVAAAASATSAAEAATTAASEASEAAATVASSLETTNENVSALDTRVTANEEAIELLGAAEITALENKVATNTTNITQVTNTVTGINTRLLTAEEEIDTLQKDVTELQECCTTVQSTITEIQEEQETQNTNIAANASDISDLDTRITNLETEDETKTTQILEITNEIGTTDISTYGTTITEAINELDTEISNYVKMPDGTVTSLSTDTNIDTDYTAASDGWFSLTVSAGGTAWVILQNQTRHIYASDNTTVSSRGMYISIPAKTGDTVHVRVGGTVNTCKLNFVV